MEYFISDLHLGHKNCIRFDKRPFETVEEMDETIIKNINKTVKKNDYLYILGDFTMLSGQDKKVAEYLDSINCKNLILIIGNHDRAIKVPKIRSKFIEVTDYKRINTNGNTLILSHYPIAVWDRKHNGSYHFYGHVHTNLDENGEVVHKMLNTDEFAKAFNVGCMMPYMDYTPRTFSEIIQAQK